MTGAPAIAMSTRGGYGLTRLLDRIDWKLRCEERRAGHALGRAQRFHALQLGLLAHARASPGPGPMACYDFGADVVDEVTRDCFVEAMSGELEAVGFRTEAGFDGLTSGARSGAATSPSLCSLLGTPHWPRIGRRAVRGRRQRTSLPCRAHAAAAAPGRRARCAEGGPARVRSPSGKKSPLDRGYTLRAWCRRCAGDAHAHPHRPAVRPCATKVTLPVGARVLVVQGRDVLIAWG